MSKGWASGQPVSVLRPASLFWEYIAGDALNPLLALVFQRKSARSRNFIVFRVLRANPPMLVLSAASGLFRPHHAKIFDAINDNFRATLSVVQHRLPPMWGHRILLLRRPVVE